MVVLTPKPGDGLTISNKRLSLNFDASINVSTRYGVMIDKNSLGGGLEGVIDHHTIVPFSKDANNNTILGANRDVVACIFSMCQYKVVNRSSVENFRVSNEIKTVEDVMNEMNAVMDYYDNTHEMFPEDMPHTTFLFKPGDFFQFRSVFAAYQYASGSVVWPVAIEDVNRTQNTPITAFFNILDVQYENTYKMTSLTLLCLWSTVAGYEQGRTYTHPITP